MEIHTTSVHLTLRFDLLLDCNASILTSYFFQACEQLNAWLGGFQTVLNRMIVDNFNWFLHSMLFIHTQRVVKRQKEKEKKRAEGKEEDDEEEEEEEEE